MKTRTEDPWHEELVKGEEIGKQTLGLSLDTRVLKHLENHPN